MPTLRTLQAGDLLCVEIEGRWAGHIAQIDETALIGHAEPFTEAAAKLQRGGLRDRAAAHEAGHHVRRAGRLPPSRSGLGGRLVAGLGLHGRGNGDDGPLLTARRKLDAVSRAIWPSTKAAASRLKPSVSLDDRAEVFRWGDSVVVTKNGGERLGTRPFALHVLR